MLMESVLLGLLGGAAGLGLAYGALRLLLSTAADFLPRLENIAIDPPALLFAFAISVVAGLLFGLIPVMQACRARVTPALRAGGRTLSQSKEAHRARNTLVVLQMALAVVLLIGSGLMIRTFQALRHVDPGFTDPAELQTLRVFIPEAQVKEPVRVVRMEQEMQQKLAEIPGVTSAAFANSVPTDGNNSTDLLYAEDRFYRKDRCHRCAASSSSRRDFFRPWEPAWWPGRDFTWTDVYDRETPASSRRTWRANCGTIRPRRSASGSARA